MKEQVAIAALDCNANRFAFQLVEAIRNEFPTSKRADRLTVRRPVDLPVAVPVPPVASLWQQPCASASGDVSSHFFVRYSPGCIGCTMLWSAVNERTGVRVSCVYWSLPGSDMVARTAGAIEHGEG